MKLRAIATQLVPPIVRSAAKKLYFHSSEALTAQRTDSKKITSNHSFTIPFTRVDTSIGSFFVPKYAEHRPASQAILHGRLYEPETHSIVAKFLHARPGSIVHAGTFFGDMLPSFAKACSRQVYAFEPVLENFLLAKLCVEENNLENVMIMNAGLSSTIAVARIDTGVECGVHLGGGSQISDHGQLTTLLTIDSFQIPDLSVIQLDVEGHELEALRGAAETIRSSHPLIMIEDNNDNCREFLHSHRYHYVGAIPGLNIWKAKDDKTDIQSVLERT